MIILQVIAVTIGIMLVYGSIYRLRYSIDTSGNYGAVRNGGDGGEVFFLLFVIAAMVIIVL